MYSRDINSDINQCNERLENVTIALNNNSLRLRFTVKGLGQKSLTLGKASDDNLKTVFHVAQQIELDLKTGNFDTSLDKYRLLHNPSYVIKLEKKEDQPVPKIGTKVLNILELWQWYKGIMINQVALSTVSTWKRTDRYLSLLPKECLELDKVNDLVSYLRSKNCNKGKGYADGTIKRTFEDLSPCVNLAKDLGKIPKTVDNFYAVWLDDSKGLFTLPEKKEILTYD
ncbi:MAG TPA: DUF3596 domain-containing protein, partial [Allocoleopsis sp.]